MSSDKLLEEQKSKHKLPGLYSGIDDVLEHERIIKSRPKGEEALAEARKIPGVRIRYRKDGSFQARGTDAASSLRLAHIFNDSRRRRLSRSEKVKARQTFVEARNRAGRTVRIHAENEREFGRRDLLVASRKTFTRGLPRCGGRNASDAEHTFVNGRCEFCGKGA